MTLVFIYGLNCPTTGRCRYVGKAINPRKRFIRHLWESNKIRSHKNNWVCSLVVQGLEPALEILDCVPSDLADQTEREYIRVFRAVGMDLTNQTDGGSGTYGFAPRIKGLKLPKPPRQATKRAKNWGHLNRLHASNTGKKRSAEARERMCKAQQQLQQLAIDRASN